MPYKNKDSQKVAKKRYRDNAKDNAEPRKDNEIANPGPENVIPNAQNKPENVIPNLDSISTVFQSKEGLRKLRAIIDAFGESNHPEYMKDVRLGVFGHTLDYINKLYCV